MKKQIILKAAIVAVVIVAVGVAQPVGATLYTWRSAVRSGLFSNYNCWSYKDGNNQTQVADASHHLTTSDDFSFWLQPSAGYYYVTNDTSTAFNGGQFSFGMVDIAGNLTTQSKTHIRIATSGTAPRLAVVNKHDGNWTIGQDLYVGGSGSSHAGNCGVFTNRSGNVYVESGWTYVGGNATGDNLPNATGVVVNVSGNIRTRSMIIGGAADNTSGTLEIQGGKVSVFVSDRLLDNKYWYSMVLATKPTSRATIRVAEGARFESEGSGHNIGMCDGPITIDIDGTFKINNGGLLNYQDNNNEGTNFVVTVGPTGRFEFRQVRGGRSGRRMLYLDGGTLAPQGDESNFLAYLSLSIKSDRDGKIEVPSGKTVDTGVWVSSLGSAKGALVKTGAGTLRITNYFRPAGGMKVRQGTLSILHNDTSFTSYDYPLSISKTGTVTGGAFVMGSGGTLEFEHASKTSGATMNITTSFTRNANIPISFSTESAFGFDDTYTLVKGGKITNTNNFSIASATANGVDITDGVYLAVESGNLVLKRSPYFYIRIAEACSLEIPKTWVDANISGDYPGETDAFKTVLSGTGANGIPRWQSYCLGLQPTNSRSVVLCDLAKEQPAEAGAFKFTTNVAIPEGLSGVAVTASLDRKSGTGDWVQQGESQTVGTAGSGSPVEFTADADPENALSFFV